MAPRSTRTSVLHAAPFDPSASSGLSALSTSSRHWIPVRARDPVLLALQIGTARRAPRSAMWRGSRVSFVRYFFSIFFDHALTGSGRKPPTRSRSIASGVELRPARLAHSAERFLSPDLGFAAQRRAAGVIRAGEKRVLRQLCAQRDANAPLLASGGRMTLSSEPAVVAAVYADVNPHAEIKTDIGTIHHQLRRLGRDRAELDAAEAYYLRAGHAVRIWEAYGHASYAAYLEAVLGYGRKTARERIRTALARSTAITPRSRCPSRAAQPRPSRRRSGARWSTPFTTAARCPGAAMPPGSMCTTSTRVPAAAIMRRAI